LENTIVALEGILQSRNAAEPPEKTPGYVVRIYQKKTRNII
jgi:hypothetical protein